MNEEHRPEDRKKLDDIVRSRIKGLGLAALFHQVDASMKDGGPKEKKRPVISEEDRKLHEKLKKGLGEDHIAASRWTALKEALRPGIPSIAGLDIGSGSIKLLETIKNKDEMVLKKAVHVPIPHIVTTAPDKLYGFTLRTLASEKVAGSLRGPSVTLLVPRALAVVKVISLPSQDKDELKKMIEFESEHHLPFSGDEAEIDSHVVSRGKTHTRVLLAAMKKTDIEERLRLLKETGVIPDMIEISSLALFNSILSSLRDEGTTLQVNIGDIFTDLNIAVGRELKATRGIRWGSGDLTGKMAEELNVSYDNAEKIKKENGIILTGSGDNDMQNTASLIAREWADRLMVEINKTVQHFQLQEGPIEIDRIVLTGGGSVLGNLDEFLKESMKTVTVMQRLPGDIPAASVPKALQDHIHEFAPLLGATWHSNAKDRLEINLLPEAIKSSRAIRRANTRKSVLVWSLASVLLLFTVFPMALFGVRGFYLRDIKERDIKLQQEAESINELKLKINTIEDYVSSKQSCMEVMRAISIIAEPDITIDKFSFEKDASVTLEGSARSHSFAVSFSRDLGDSPLFKSVRLKYTRKKNSLKKEVGFGIVCDMARTP